MSPPVKQLQNQFRITWILRLIGWSVLFWTNWKFGLAFLCIEAGEKFENNLYRSSNENIIKNILTSLEALIKRDDITEESKKIRNN